MTAPHAIRAIIFDMDGVLMHSSPIHEAAYRQALAGVPGADFEYHSIAGMRTDEAMRRVLGANNITVPDDQIATLSAEKSRLARAWIAERNPIDPATRSTLETLSSRYRLALASSASKPTVDLFLDSNQLRQFFDCVLDGSDVKAAKPAPDIYLMACARLGLAPSECLVIEDAVNGVEAAKSAGAPVWGLPTTCRPESLLAAGAGRVLPQLQDLAGLAEAR